MYLGDKLHKSGTISANINHRKARGFGIVNEILAMIKEAPLSWWKVKAGLILRQARLVNGMIFNSEAWHGLTLKQTIELEKVDEALIRGLIGGHSKLPIPALYTETGQMTIRFIISKF